MTKRECHLCGYPSADYRIIPVPLSSPPQDNAVCADCLEELTAPVAAERDDYRARLKDAIEFCKREEKMTSFLLKLVQEARKRARNYRRILLDNYGDAAVQALFAEDDCYFYWLREDDNRPQEVAIDDD
jgi:hypothetical protein